jgi:hypothetical protein
MFGLSTGGRRVLYVANGTCYTSKLTVRGAGTMIANFEV